MVHSPSLAAKTALFALMALPLVGGQAKAAVLASWDFEDLSGSLNQTGTNFGPLASTTGTGKLFAQHASASTDFTSPVGNGSDRSLSSNNWAIGDYYEFYTGSNGFKDLKLSWSQTSSNAGPGDFGVMYSTDGVHFNLFSGYTVAPNSWSFSSQSLASNKIVDLSSVLALNDKGLLSLRLVMNGGGRADGGTAGVLATGTSRIDNVSIEGIPIPSAVPAPLPLFGLAGAFGVSRRLRRRVRLQGPSA